jgi:hypothetical protein
MPLSLGTDDIENRALLPIRDDNSTELETLSHDRSDPGHYMPRERALSSNEAVETAGARRIHEPTNQSAETSSSTDPESLRYATTALLARYIPEADQDHKKWQPFYQRMGRSKIMLATQLLLALITCFCNIAFLIWAYGVDKPLNGIGTLYKGECDSIGRLNTGAHVILNVFSSLFLGAGSYCMQVLVAPSRGQVRRANSLGRSYDIGVHSLYNLRQLHFSKQFLWLGLCLCSTLLHFM